MVIESSASENAEPAEPPVESKSDRTRSAIIDAALGLFLQRGYDATTMRAIAAEAGVSVGNAYYYFDSKEHLIQGFYDRAQVEHESAARVVLDTEKDLSTRIIGVGEAWVNVMEPYRSFAGKFFKNAAEPTSPLSPFSSESGPSRDASIAIWREVLEGSSFRIPKRIREKLPELVWLHFMGIVLFWVYDPTPDASATKRLIGQTAPLLVTTIGLMRMPVIRKSFDEISVLIDDLHSISRAPDSGPIPT